MPSSLFFLIFCYSQIDLLQISFLNISKRKNKILKFGPCHLKKPNARNIRGSNTVYGFFFWLICTIAFDSPRNLFHDGSEPFEIVSDPFKGTKRRSFERRTNAILVFSFLFISYSSLFPFIFILLIRGIIFADILFTKDLLSKLQQKFVFKSLCEEVNRTRTFFYSISIFLFFIFFILSLSIILIFYYS